jgi:hypothetical protein
MIVQEKFAEASAAVAASEAPETLIEWQSQSCDELKAIASRGAHGGELYFAAVKELERRAHDTETVIETQETVAIARRREIISTVMILLAAIIVAATARLLGY